MSAHRVAYLVPEFPGQTHTWIWRELACLRRWGADIKLVSTRPPPARDRAQHAFAAAAAETYYLFRPASGGMVAVLRDTLRYGVPHPRGVARATRLAMTLPIDGGANLRTCLPLVAPAARLAFWCRREGIAHVHCHTCASGAVIAMLAEAMGGVPYSLTINANLDWWGGAMREKIAGATFAMSTMRWVKAEIDETYPAEIAAKVHYAPVGVDTELWQPTAHAPEVAGRELLLVCVGRLHASKGFDVALEALRRVVEAGVDARLSILGEGPERGALERRADELGVRPRVRFKGTVPEAAVRAAMAAADIFLLPSHAEPLGVVVMEAMAMETAVIVTASGGVGEIVTPGRDGLAVPPRDPAAFAAAILDLAHDATRRRELGVRGRRTIIERFDAQVGARAIHRHLFGLAAGGDDPAAGPAPAPLVAGRSRAAPREGQPQLT